MKRILGITGILLAAAVMISCNDDDNTINSRPAAPQGVYSVTGDHQVEIVWNGIYDRDVKEYIVYRSDNPTTDYVEIGRVTAQDNPHLDLIIYNFIDDNLTNGTTYYYGVTALDHSNQESPLSAEEVFDTPRPSGVLSVYSLYQRPASSGLMLGSAPAITSYNDSAADIYVDTANGVFYLNAANINTDIQDVGATQNFDEIGFAPDNGWSALGYLELIFGHTYIIWTADNHYAKVRVADMNMNLGYVTFEWAYQTDTGNPELAPGIPGVQKPSHGAGYLRALRAIAVDNNK